MSGVEQCAGRGGGACAQLLLQYPFQLPVLLKSRVRLLRLQEKPDKFPVPLLIERIDRCSLPRPVNRLVEVPRVFLVLDQFPEKLEECILQVVALGEDPPIEVPRQQLT